MARSKVVFASHQPIANRVERLDRIGLQREVVDAAALEHRCLALGLGVADDLEHVELGGRSDVDHGHPDITVFRAGLRAVALDFYGTLVVEREDEQAVDEAILARYGYELAGANRMHWIDPVTTLDHAEFSVNEEAYRDYRRRLWSQGLRAAGVDDGHLDQLVEHAEARSLGRGLVLFDDTVASLQGRPLFLSLATMAENALRAENERLEREFNEGQPFGPVGKVKTGRPVGRRAE